MDSLSRAFISQTHRCPIYRAQGKRTRKSKSSVKDACVLHVFKDLPAVIAGTGGRVDNTRAAEEGGNSL